MLRNLWPFIFAKYTDGDLKLVFLPRCILQMNLNCQYFWHNLMCCLPPTLFSITEKGKKRDRFPGEVYAVLGIKPRTSSIAGTIAGTCCKGRNLGSAQHINQNGGGCAEDLGHRALGQQGWVLNAKQVLGHFPYPWKPESPWKHSSLGKSQPERETCHLAFFF